MGPPPELHHHFVAALKDLPAQSEEDLQTTIDLLLNDIEEVELTLKKAELQMKNKDLDTGYYHTLVQKTEVEIGQCSSEI